MCVGDWRFGRFIRSTYATYTIGGLPSSICKPNRQRVGLLIGHDPAGTTTVYGIKNGGTLYQFVEDQLAFEPMYYNIRDHGDIVQQEWQAVNLTGCFINVVEQYLPEEIFAMAIDSLLLEYPGWPKQ